MSEQHPPEAKIPRLRPVNWRSTVTQGAGLFSLWLVLSGHLDTFHVSLGILSVVAVLLLNSRINRVRLFETAPREGRPFRFELLGGFLLWLSAEIIAASLHVVYVVLHPRMPVAPSILRFRVGLSSPAAKVLLGNIITLTPGTTTLDVSGDEFIVHTLTPKASESIINGMMVRRVARLFNDAKGNVISEIRVTRDMRDA